MLFKSTFLQSSSIWKVMSALFITVRDACGQIHQQYYQHEHTHIPYQLCLFIWIFIKKKNTFRAWEAPDIDGLGMFVALESEKISWTLRMKNEKKYD